ncbi:TPA: dTDP-6-deoxy-D-glucose-3,5-epimerase [Citrobacter sedlakii]|nr:dTDP-6-deoxy-D-glucose-3,5-epimerase [Escherichia coli]EFO4017513.1 dTDP-6-deoxy-D-glucose-3,5-epimerase [Escherichia coli]
MKAFTRERLLKIQQWRETYGPGSNVVLPAEEAEELARIALASLEAEAVGFIARHKETGKFGSYLHPKADWFKSDDYEVLSAYASPPAPVVPDEVNLAIENLKQKLVECNRYNYCSDAVKRIEDSCRAAMLQGKG